MTNHPNRRVVRVIRRADGTVFGPFTTLQAARFALAEFLSPTHPAHALFVGARIERIGKMTDDEAQQFGGELNSARLSK